MDSDVSGQSPTSSSGPWADLQTYYPAWLGYRHWYLRIPGVQAALRRHGEVVLSTACGRADLEDGRPLTAQHLFRIASHSKSFTAVLMMQLAERGALRLDDPLAAHLPELDGSAIGDRTLGEIAGHGAGIIRDSTDGDFWQLAHPFPNRDELIAIARDASAAVLPANEHYKYSNIGYGLLGLVIEAAGGAPYADQLRTRIVEPLGLADTGAELDPARAADYAAGYSALSTSRSRHRIEHVDTRALAAATGCYATATDLTAFYSALLPDGDALRPSDAPPPGGDAPGSDKDRLLRPASVRRMRHRAWSVKGEERGYGLGLSLTRVAETDLFGHTGGYPGHITCSYADPADGEVLSVLTNAIDGAASALADGYFQLRTLARKADHARCPEDASRFTGRFSWLWGVRDVVRLDGRLFAISPVAADPAEDAVPLEVVDHATLKMVGGRGGNSYGELMSYRFDADGAVVSVRGDSAMTMTPFLLSEAERTGPRDDVAGHGCGDRANPQAVPDGDGDPA